MIYYKLTETELKFTEIIWDNAPISSGELVKLCEEKFNWKKSTTYTMLRKLIDKGIFSNIDGFVNSIINKEEFFALQSNSIVEESFEGSLPKFITAFTKRKKLSEKDIIEIQKMIDSFKEELKWVEFFRKLLAQVLQHVM